ncbi:MAG: hypothetical protein ACYTBZ_01335 [Planctomycetota bacterium]
MKKRRVQITVKIVTVIVACVIAFVIYHMPRFTEITLEPDDPLPTYDAYLTWKNHDINTDYRPSKALYVWNGTIVGQGEEGFKKVLNRIEEMPLGSKILVYPRTFMNWELHYSDDIRMFPWSNFHCDFLDKMKERKHTVIYSPRDHLGNMHPQCINPYENKEKEKK